MRRFFFRFMAITALLVTLVAPMVSTTAFAAFDPLKGPDCTSSGEVANSAVCQQKSNGNPLTGENGMLINVTRMIAAIAGFVAIVMMAIAGIRYITSNGAADQTAQAKKTIIYSAIGLVVIALSQAAITFILKRI